MFAEPVTDDIAPGYSSMIAHPVDLKTISEKIEGGRYRTVKEFKVQMHTYVYMLMVDMDVHIMYVCVEYNGCDISMCMDLDLFTAK